MNLAERLIDVVHELQRLSFAPASTGNVSVRVGPDRFMITPSGVPYRDLSEQHLVTIDGHGEVVEGELEPSSDTPVHLAVYRSRPDAASVLHCHPPQATTLACLGWPLPPVHYMAASLATDGWIKVACYATYGTEELGANALLAMGETRKACLLANHGILSIGDDVESALARTVTLDWIAGVYLRACGLMAEPPQLSGPQVAEAAQKLAGYGKENRARLRQGAMP